MGIPEERTRIQVLISQIDAAIEDCNNIEKKLKSFQQELELVHQGMFRATPTKRRAPVTSKQVTPEMAYQIRKLAKEHPNYSNQKIADIFKVNPGRVSEVLQGKR